MSPKFYSPPHLVFFFSFILCCFSLYLFSSPRLSLESSLYLHFDANYCERRITWRRKMMVISSMMATAKVKFCDSLCLQHFCHFPFIRNSSLTKKKVLRPNLNIKNCFIGVDNDLILSTLPSNVDIYVHPKYCRIFFDLNVKHII